MKPHYLTIPISCFLGAFAGYLQSAAPLLSMAAAKPVLAGALLAGVVAVAHLYMPSPQSTAVSGSGTGSVAP